VLHGFRDLFRAVFAQCPEAIFRTAVDTCADPEDFDGAICESGNRNIARDRSGHDGRCLRCPDRGIAG